MDHTVCLNTNSFPASNPMDAYELFYESLQGLLALNTGTDRYIGILHFPVNTLSPKKCLHDKKMFLFAVNENNLIHKATKLS